MQTNRLLVGEYFWISESSKVDKMLIEIEKYAGEGRIYSFYTENEGSDDHYLFKNLRKVAEISIFKTLNIDLLIPKIYPHKDEEMILQYEREIK